MDIKTPMSGNTGCMPPADNDADVPGKLSKTHGTLIA